MSCYPYGYIPDCHKDIKYAYCIGCAKEFNVDDMGHWDKKKNKHIQTFLCIDCHED